MHMISLLSAEHLVDIAVGYINKAEEMHAGSFKCYVGAMDLLLQAVSQYRDTDAMEWVAVLYSRDKLFGTLPLETRLEAMTHWLELSCGGDKTALEVKLKKHRASINRLRPLRETRFNRSFSS